MTIAVGSDHAGFLLKTHLVEYLRNNSIAFQDMGTFSENRVDYPDFALKVARAVARGECEFGIVVCGTGIGVSIVANKVKGIRAALCCSVYMAEMARRHNNANVLALGGRTTQFDLAEKMLRTFLSIKFEGGRHADRVEKIHRLSGK